MVVYSKNKLKCHIFGGGNIEREDKTLQDTGIMEIIVTHYLFTHLPSTTLEGP